MTDSVCLAAYTISHGECDQQWCYPSTEKPRRDLLDSYFHVRKTQSRWQVGPKYPYIHDNHINCLERRTWSSFSKHVLGKNCTTLTSNCCKTNKFLRIKFLLSWNWLQNPQNLHTTVISTYMVYENFLYYHKAFEMPQTIKLLQLKLLQERYEALKFSDTWRNPLTTILWS